MPEGASMIEIPSFLSHLTTFAGFPVPYTVMWFNGRPDFRVIDREKALQCERENLCAICGKKMFRFYFVGGPQSMASGQFTDGPVHLCCAEFSSSICPFLSGKRLEHSLRPIQNDTEYAIIHNDHVDTKRPEKMFILEARNYHLGLLAPDGNPTRESPMIYQVMRWCGSAKEF